MFVSQHISVAALCLALFSLPLSMAQSTATTTVSVTETATVTTTTTIPTPAPTVDPGVGAWSYQGCFNETTSNSKAGNVRALDANSTASDTETPATCISYCDSLSFSWAGLEYGRECYCGPNLNSNSDKLDEQRCNLPCMGDESVFCGGLLALTIYARNGPSNGHTLPTSDAVSLSRQANTMFGPVMGSLLALGSFSLIKVML